VPTLAGRLNLPYPAGTASADVPADILALLAALESNSLAKFSQGVAASRPVSTPGSPGIQGRFYYATDTFVVSYDYGTGWFDVGGSSRVTSLSGVTPSNGMQVDLADDANNPTYSWRLRYNANRTTEGGAYKWERVAGDYRSDDTGTGMAALNPTYNATATSAAAFTFPRNGIYSVEAQAFAQVGGILGATTHVCQFNLLVGGTPIQQTIGEVVWHDDPTNVNQYRWHEEDLSVHKIVTATAGQTVQFSTVSGPNAQSNLAPRKLIVTPIRIA
jgi:hypothetical protein